MTRLLIATLALAGATAHAFCGFYVAGGGAELFNNATQVVLMREGTRTVLSMQNNYQGPPEDFAMVIPVPVVLKKENVKTLKKEIFARVDTLAAPRLVEYWEVDPCYVEEVYPDEEDTMKSEGGVADPVKRSPKGLGVKIEAQFSVGEYDIVVLSAKDALGLEKWLKQEKYKIPEGSEPLFRPYIQQGMKFFVARVDAKKVTFDKTGMAALSPLRFHYDSEKFDLPIRLGLINAKTQQDLIVHVLARNQRYEVANYPNVTIPTNVDLVPSAKGEFPFFYVSLFDRTLKANPRAVITEYAWQASSCDPCPTSPLTAADFQTLGADVVPSKGVVKDQYDPTQGYVLTRLHARYDKASLGEDLVFRAAGPIVGGREFLTKGDTLEQGSKADSLNNFQARYAIRYPWTGPIACKEPVYGRWGGPPNDKLVGGTQAARDTAFAARDPSKVEKLAESSIAELQVKGLKAQAGKPLRKAKMILALLLAAAPPIVLPDETAPRSPGQVRVQGEELVIPSANFSDGKDCGSCHADIAAQWKTSTHAFASFTNPIYRVSIDKLRDDRGTAPSRMCAACHDLALLTAGAMDEQEIAAEDPRSHAGVSCTTCHSTVHTTRDGNGSLTLRADEVFPSAPMDSTLAKHRARVASSTLRTAELCGSCHRSFLTDETGNASAFFGMDDYGAWQRSAWAGTNAERPDHVASQDCRSCHMPRESAVLGDVSAKNGTVPSHRFLGAHTTLAAMRGDTAQVARLQAFLEKSATIDVAAVKVNDAPWSMPAEAARPRPGDLIDIDVVVFNERTGHRFPGGVLDNQGTRVEVTVRTATGQVLAISDEHEVRAQVVDERGTPVQRRETHEFVTAVWNHTVPPRDARVTRVRALIPSGLPADAFPLKVEARLTHRARSEEMMKMACDELKTPRGKAFQAASLVHTGAKLDPCVPQPVTLIDRAEVSLLGIASHDTWLRSYRRGLGLSVGLQEYLDEAETAFEHARGLAVGEDAGVALWALGQLAGKRGQLPRALELLAAAEKVLGRTAAIQKARGDAYGQVWKWREAAAAWSGALQLAPTELGLWQSVAMAEASIGRYSQALTAAQGGLALHPRDGDCLRVQALALQHLGRPADAALDAALKWRTPDDGPRAKALCSAQIPGCAQRRNPVPLYEARSTPN